MLCQVRGHRKGGVSCAQERPYSEDEKLQYQLTGPRPVGGWEQQRTPLVPALRFEREAETQEIPWKPTVQQWRKQIASGKAEGEEQGQLYVDLHMCAIVYANPHLHT